MRYSVIVHGTTYVGTIDELVSKLACYTDLPIHAEVVTTTPAPPEVREDLGRHLRALAEVRDRAFAAQRRAMARYERLLALKNVRRDTPEGPLKNLLTAEIADLERENP